MKKYFFKHDYIKAKIIVRRYKIICRDYAILFKNHPSLNNLIKVQTEKRDICLEYIKAYKEKNLKKLKEIADSKVLDHIYLGL